MSSLSEKQKALQEKTDAEVLALFDFGEVRINDGKSSVEDVSSMSDNGVENEKNNLSTSDDPEISAVQHDKESWREAVWNNKGLITKEILKGAGSVLASLTGVKLIAEVKSFRAKKKALETKKSDFLQEFGGVVDGAQIDDLLKKFEAKDGFSDLDKDREEVKNFQAEHQKFAELIYVSFSRDKIDQKLRELDVILEEYVEKKAAKMKMLKEGLNSLSFYGGALGSLAVGPAAYAVSKAVRVTGYGAMDYAEAKKKLKKESGDDSSTAWEKFREMFYDHAAYQNGGKLKKTLELTKAAGRIARYAGFALTDFSTLESIIPGVSGSAKKAVSKVDYDKLLDAFERKIDSGKALYGHLVSEGKIIPVEATGFDDAASPAADTMTGNPAAFQEANDKIKQELSSGSTAATSYRIPVKLGAANQGGAVADPVLEEKPAFQGAASKPAAVVQADAGQAEKLSGASQVAEKAAAGKPIEVKITGKTDTFSEAINKAVRKAPTETQEKFIRHVLGDDVEIKNTRKMIGEAVRKLSVANADGLHDESVKSLVYKGNIVSLNEDGSWNVLKGTGVYEPRAINEDILTKGSEQVRESIELKSPDVEIIKSATMEPVPNAEVVLEKHVIGGKEIRAKLIPYQGGKNILCVDSDGDGVVDSVQVFQENQSEPIYVATIEKNVDEAVAETEIFLDYRSVQLKDLNEKGLNANTLKEVGIDPWQKSFGERDLEKISFLEERAVKDDPAIFVKALNIVDHFKDANVNFVDAEKYYSILQRIDKGDSIRAEGLVAMLNGVDSTQKEAVVNKVFSGVETIKEKFNLDFTNKNDGLHIDFSMKGVKGDGYEALIRPDGSAKITAKGLLGFLDKKEFRTDRGWSLKEVLEWPVKKE